MTIQERNDPALIGEVTGRDVDNNVRVNLRSRFAYLLDFTKKANEYSDDAITMHDWELDLFLHLAAYLDLLSGFNINNGKIDKIRFEIETGAYGDDIRNLFKRLNDKDQDIILRHYSYFKNGALTAFKNAFKELYADGLIYKKQDTIYVYIDKDQNDQDDVKFELLKKLFIPLDMKLNIHFKYHMGIIGIKETMKIGKIRIV